jgi:2-phosphoglycerate kinase
MREIESRMNGSFDGYEMLRFEIQDFIIMATEFGIPISLNDEKEPTTLRVLTEIMRRIIQLEGNNINERT